MAKPVGPYSGPLDWEVDRRLAHYVDLLRERTDAEEKLLLERLKIHEARVNAFETQKMTLIGFIGAIIAYWVGAASAFSLGWTTLILAIIVLIGAGLLAHIVLRQAINERYAHLLGQIAASSPKTPHAPVDQGKKDCLVRLHEEAIACFQNASFWSVIPSPKQIWILKSFEFNAIMIYIFLSFGIVSLICSLLLFLGYSLVEPVGGYGV